MRTIVVGLAIVVGLVLAVTTSSSYAIRVPAHDVSIPIWLGDPDNVDCSRELPKYEAKGSLILEDGFLVTFRAGASPNCFTDQELRPCINRQQSRQNDKLISHTLPRRVR